MFCERLWLSALTKAYGARNVMVLSEYPKQFCVWGWKRYAAARGKGHGCS